MCSMNEDGSANSGCAWVVAILTFLFLLALARLSTYPLALGITP